MKYLYWISANFYGYVLGRKILAPIHQMIVNLCMHGLGYDNSYRDSWTGEKWFLKKIICPSNPKICFDVGANVGNYTQILLEHTKSKIYAMEPTLASFKKLSTLKSERVMVSQIAVSDDNGNTTIYFKKDLDVKASLDKNISEGTREEKIETITIETFAKNNLINDIDFLKIDTEGHEREVLRGLGNIRPKFIQFEFNIHHLYKNCTLFSITELLPGYTFYRLLPHGMIKIDPRKYISNVFMFCNIVAIKN